MVLAFYTCKLAVHSLYLKGELCDNAKLLVSTGTLILSSQNISILITILNTLQQGVPHSDV